MSGEAELYRMQQNEIDRLTAALKDAEQELVLWRRGHAEQVKRADDAERERERLCRALDAFEQRVNKGQGTSYGDGYMDGLRQAALQEPAPQGAEAERQGRLATS